MHSSRFGVLRELKALWLCEAGSDLVKMPLRAAHPVLPRCPGGHARGPAGDQPEVTLAALGWATTSRGIFLGCTVGSAPLWVALSPVDRRTVKQLRAADAQEGAVNVLLLLAGLGKRISAQAGISPKSILLRTSISHTSGPLRSQGFTRGGPTGTSLKASPHHQPCPQPSCRPSLCTQRGQGAETCPQNPWPHVRLGCGTACPSPCPSPAPSVPSSPRWAAALRCCAPAGLPAVPSSPLH